jgi:hypothetical protein
MTSGPWVWACRFVPRVSGSSHGRKAVIWPQRRRHVAHTGIYRIRRGSKRAAAYVCHTILTANDDRARTMHLSPHAPTASSCQPLWRLYWTRTTNDVPAAHRPGADTAPKPAHAMLPTNARLAILDPTASSRHDRIRRDGIRRVTGSFGVSRWWIARMMCTKRSIGVIRRIAPLKVLGRLMTRAPAKSAVAATTSSSRRCTDDPSTQQHSVIASPSY